MYQTANIVIFFLFYNNFGIFYFLKLRITLYFHCYPEYPYIAFLPPPPPHKKKITSPPRPSPQGEGERAASSETGCRGSRFSVNAFQIGSHQATTASLLPSSCGEGPGVGRKDNMPGSHNRTTPWMLSWGFTMLCPAGTSISA